MIDNIRERRAAWAFRVTNDGASWEWQRTQPDGTLARSTRSFSSIAECGKDARKHGYGEWKMSERRHVTPGRDVLGVEPVTTTTRLAHRSKQPKPAAKKQSRTVSATRLPKKGRAKSV
jgi:hypothetical protein